MNFKKRPRLGELYLRRTKWPHFSLLLAQTNAESCSSDRHTSLGGFSIGLFCRWQCFFLVDRQRIIFFLFERVLSLGWDFLADRKSLQTSTYTAKSPLRFRSFKTRFSFAIYPFFQTHFFSLHTHLVNGFKLLILLFELDSIYFVFCCSTVTWISTLKEYVFSLNGIDLMKKPTIARSNGTQRNPLSGN